MEGRELKNKREREKKGRGKKGRDDLTEKIEK